MIARNRIYPGAVVKLLYPPTNERHARSVQIVEVLLLNGTKAMIYCRFYANGEAGPDLLGPYSYIDFE
jgi:hypothetical protein